MLNSPQNDWKPYFWGINIGFRLLVPQKKLISCNHTWWTSGASMFSPCLSRAQATMSLAVRPPSYSLSSPLKKNLIVGNPWIWKVKTKIKKLVLKAARLSSLTLLIKYHTNRRAYEILKTWKIPISLQQLTTTWS